MLGDRDRGPARAEAARGAEAAGAADAGAARRSGEDLRARRGHRPLIPADHDVRTRFVKLASRARQAARGDADADARRHRHARPGGAGAHRRRSRRSLPRARRPREGAGAPTSRCSTPRADEEASLHAARALRRAAPSRATPRGLPRCWRGSPRSSPEEEARLDAIAELAAVAERELGRCRRRRSRRTSGSSARGSRPRRVAALAPLYEAMGAFAALVGVLDRRGRRARSGAGPGARVPGRGPSNT